MDAKPSNYEEFSWAVFLDSVSKIGRTEITEQLERELWELYPLQTERIQ